MKIKKKKKKKIELHHWLLISVIILRVLHNENHFRNLNMLAFAKILKKFDKVSG
jgi:SPX domain protein involved in polyphosphate accumulation